jgi:hypothetical protein
MRQLTGHSVFGIALTCAFACRAAIAQAPGGIPANARVRVETTNGNLETGRVVATRRDSLWLRIDRVDSIAAYPIAGLRTYAVSRGTPRGHGARRGALISGALGLVAVGLSLHADLTTRDDIIIPATLFVAPAAIIFTLVGTGLGALFVEERWAAPEWVRVGMVPGADGRVALAYHVVF